VAPVPEDRRLAGRRLLATFGWRPLWSAAWFAAALESSISICRMGATHHVQSDGLHPSYGLLSGGANPPTRALVG